MTEAEGLKLAAELGAACRSSMRQLAIDCGAKTEEEIRRLCAVEIYLCDGYGRVIKKYGGD